MINLLIKKNTTEKCTSENSKIFGDLNNKKGICFKNSCEPPNYIYYDTEKKKVNLYLQQHLLVLLVLILK